MKDINDVTPLSKDHESWSYNYVSDKKGTWQKGNNNLTYVTIGQVKLE